MISDEKAFKIGRGQGEKDDFKPWILSTDVKGLGRKHRIPSQIFKRKRHALSTIEANLIYVTEMADNIVDSREQFPLKLEQTKLIASRLGIKHPLSPDRKREVMTFDLLIDHKDQTQHAIAVKPLSELYKKRNIEILQIQKIYAEELSMKFSIITEKDFPIFLLANLKMLRAYFNIKNELDESFCKKIKEVESSDVETRIIINSIAKELRITSSKAWSMFYHQCATKQIKFNYYESFNENIPFSKLIIR